MAHGKDLRMRPDSTAPLSWPLRNASVSVADGYGIRVFVQRGQLVVEDGVGRNRRRRVYARATHGLSRLVLLGREGFVTLEALRWLTDLGIAFLHIDRNGRVLASSQGGSGDARLRRLQALCATTSTGLEISRSLLRMKLTGQARVLATLDANAELVSAFESSMEALEAADSLGELVFAERDAALAYWTAWAPVNVTFARSDAKLVPEYWLRFGKRGSPLTSAPRLAINPANALLNYLYAILEAETRIACLTVGLDPGLGIVHVDYRSRDSFVLDLMEAARPDVDAYVLDLLRSRAFTRRDFSETRRGICRVLAPLSHELIKTAPHWASTIAPIVEGIASQLSDSPGSRIDQLSTPLTGTNRAAGRTRKPRRHSRVAKATQPQPSKVRTPTPMPACKRCNEPVPRRERVYCDACLPHYQREQYAKAFSGSGLEAIERMKQTGHDPTHTAAAEEKRGATTAERKRAIREWEARYGKLTDLAAFGRDILPLIQGVSLSRLRCATGLSVRYVSQVRRGEKIPHPKHWDAFLSCAHDDDERTG